MTLTIVDETVKNLTSVMPDRIRHPEAFEKTGFPCFANKGNAAKSDAIRNHASRYGGSGIVW